jgi:hypothetical protein
VDGVGGGERGALGGLTGRQWAVLLVLTLSTFLVLVDASVVNLALPRIVGDLDGTLDGATWVVASYVLAFASLLLLFGRLGDVFGRRRLFVWGLRSSRRPPWRRPSRPPSGLLWARGWRRGWGRRC